MPRSVVLVVGIHFVILGTMTAALLSFISAARLIISAQTTSKRWMGFFLCLVVLAFCLTYTRPVNALACLASLIGTWATFQPADRTIRIVIMFVTTLWIVHNVIVGSPAATALESFFLASNVIGFYRFYLRGVSSEDDGRPHLMI